MQDYPTSSFEELPDEEMYRKLTPVEWAYHVPEMLMLLREAAIYIADSVPMNWPKRICQDEWKDSSEYFITTRTQMLLAKLYSRKYHETCTDYLGFAMACIDDMIVIDGPECNGDDDSDDDWDGAYEIEKHGQDSMAHSHHP